MGKPETMTGGGGGGSAGSPMHRENREKWPQKIPVCENIGNSEILPKHSLIVL